MLLYLLCWPWFSLCAVLLYLVSSFGLWYVLVTRLCSVYVRVYCVTLFPSDQSGVMPLSQALSSSYQIKLSQHIGKHTSAIPTVSFYFILLFFYFLTKLLLPPDLAPDFFQTLKPVFLMDLIYKCSAQHLQIQCSSVGISHCAEQLSSSPNGSFFPFPSVFVWDKWVSPDAFRCPSTAPGCGWVALPLRIEQT